MIINQELVKKIRSHFNLNIYETKVWIALLSKGVASAGEVAELSEVPRSRTYDVLESLEKRGFAIVKLGKPVKYMAVKPQLVLEKLKRNMIKNTDEKIKILSKLKETAEYEELQALHKTGIEPIKHTELSGAIKGKTNLYSHIREILENSEKQVAICMPASELGNKNRVFNSLFDKLKNQGINIKLALSGTEQDIKAIEKKFKIKALKIPINAKFFISDKKQVLLITNNPGDEEELGIWLNSEFFASTLSHLFETSLKR